MSGEAAKRETYPWKIFISLTDWQTDWLLLLHRRLAPLGTSILFRVFLLATTSRRGTICLLLEVSTTIDYNATDDGREPSNRRSEKNLLASVLLLLLLDTIAKTAPNSAMRRAKLRTRRTDQLVHAHSHMGGAFEIMCVCMCVS